MAPWYIIEPKQQPCCFLYCSNLVRPATPCSCKMWRCRCKLPQYVLSSAAVEEQQHSSVPLSRRSENWGGSWSLRGYAFNDSGAPVLMETSVSIDFIYKKKCKICFYVAWECRSTNIYINVSSSLLHQKEMSNIYCLIVIFFMIRVWIAKKLLLLLTLCLFSVCQSHISNVLVMATSLQRRDV